MRCPGVRWMRMWHRRSFDLSPAIYGSDFSPSHLPAIPVYYRESSTSSCPGCSTYPASLLTILVQWIRGSCIQPQFWKPAFASSRVMTIPMWYCNCHSSFSSWFGYQLLVKSLSSFQFVYALGSCVHSIDILHIDQSGWLGLKPAQIHPALEIDLYTLSQMALLFRIVSTNVTKSAGATKRLSTRAATGACLRLRPRVLIELTTCTMLSRFKGNHDMYHLSCGILLLLEHTVVNMV